MTARALERPVLAVDVVLLRALEGGLSLLLHRRAEGPFRGRLALPGVAVRADETLEEAARRALADKAGLPAEHQAGLHLEQLATFDALFRDPRGRTVSVAYLGLARPGSFDSGGIWRRQTELARGSLPFDHDAIVVAALARLAGKLRYTNIAARLLEPLFRLEEIQTVYEAILGRNLNRANFRTKLLKIGLIERVGVEPAPGPQGGRPPHLYRFRHQRTEVTERDFL